jgi:hypothetical protein
VTYSSLSLPSLPHQCNSCSFRFLSLRCRRLPVLARNLSVTTVINILACTPRSSTTHPHHQLTTLFVVSVVLTLSEATVTSNPPQHNLLNRMRILKLKLFHLHYPLDSNARSLVQSLFTHFNAVSADSSGRAGLRSLFVAGIAALTFRRRKVICFI